VHEVFVCVLLLECVCLCCLLFRRKAPEVATRVPFRHRHGNVHQYVHKSIEQDEGGAHLEEAERLGDLFHESRYQVFQARGQWASVRVEVRCETQPKGFIE